MGRMTETGLSLARAGVALAPWAAADLRRAAAAAARDIQGPERLESLRDAVADEPVSLIMEDETKARQFRELALPHLDDAYNLARWLTGSAQDADDVVQDAYMRAYQFFDGFRGSNPRAWILTIVRNSYYAWLRKARSQSTVPLKTGGPGDEPDGGESEPWDPEQLDAEALLIRKSEADALHA